MKTPEKALTEWADGIIWFDWGFERKWWTREEFTKFANQSREVASRTSEELLTVLDIAISKVLVESIYRISGKNVSVFEPRRLVRFDGLRELMDYVDRQQSSKV